MTSELIRAEIEKIVKDSLIKSLNISDDKAFSYMLLSLFFNVKKFDDTVACVTDAANDGGVDFVYFDEEDSKLVISQSKYTETLSYSEIKIEFDKICDTINNFRRGNTGSYNENVRKVLQNYIDRLPDDEQDNIEISLFTSASNVNDTEEIIIKLNNDIPELDKFIVSVYSRDDIEKKIQEKYSEITVVSYAKIEIDKAGNYLQYETEHARGIMVNIKSVSLTSLYNKFASQGLF